jgi:hypothetical protein
VEHWRGALTSEGWSLSLPGAPDRSGPGDETALAAAIETCFIESLNARHPDACLLHAGLVELGGVWILFAGDSDRGKSSLTLEAVRRGGRYFTDELVVADASRVWAICRTPVFNPGPVDLPLPSWLEGADRESFAYTIHGRRHARPLFSVPRTQWARAPISTRDVVVVRIDPRGPDRVAPIKGAEALATLLDATLTREYRPLGPLASDRRAFAITWTSPSAAIDLLRDATSHLATDRPLSAP